MNHELNGHAPEPEADELDDAKRSADAALTGLLANPELRADREKQVKAAWGYADLMMEQKRARGRGRA